MTTRQATIYQAVGGSLRFVYENSLRLVAISVLWFVLSLPIVTLGVTTLGAYTAILSICETGSIGTKQILRRVRTYFIATTVLGFLPLFFVGIALLYAREYVNSGSMFVLFAAIVTGYAGVFTILVLIPTFINFSAGNNIKNSIKGGYLWTASHSGLSLFIGIYTLVVGVVTALLTVMFVILFPALVFTFHIKIIRSESGNVLADP